MLKRNKCTCPKSSYNLVFKQSVAKKGLYLEKITYDVEECKNHPLSHGKRKNEIHRIYTEILSPLPQELDNYEKKIFIESFKNGAERKILKKKWDAAIEASIKDRDQQRGFLDKFLQNGVIELIQEYYNTKSGKKEYVYLTDNGYDFLKQHLDIVEKNEQIELCRKMILETFESKPDSNSIQEKHIRSLLSQQIDLINSGTPFWIQKTGEQIIPHSVQKNAPLYYIITKALCTWLKIYRSRITKKELSCVGFSTDRIVKAKDPSKVLDKYYEILSSIIDPQSCDFQDLNDFGLIKTLEIIQTSGHLQLTLTDQEIEMNDPLNLMNSLEHQNFKSISTTHQNILFVENIAVFTQMMMDRFSFNFNTLIIFIHGKSSKYLQKILKTLGKSCNMHQYYAWVDNDQGGLEIFTLLQSLMLHHTILPIIPFSSKPIPYRKFSGREIDKIAKIGEGGTKESKMFAEHLLNSGKIEQEYFINNYIEIMSKYIQNSKLKQK